jgi:hypothetical protein
LDNFNKAKKLAKEKNKNSCEVIESKTILVEESKNLEADTKDMSRLITSLIEELEAVNFYEQRSVASEDESIINLMIHNRDEEIEHTAMIIEEIRKRNEVWNKSLKEFLFKDDSEVVEVEEEKTFTE